jgi:orotate phosphoribosyltransferase
MKHFASAKHVMMGTMGLVVLSALSGCQSAPEEKQSTQEGQNKFIVVEQQPSGKYVVVEEVPTTGPSHAIIRSTDENGTVTERVMSEAEMKQLADQEYKKMQEGKSELNAEPKSEGMGLGGTILAAAGGALLGNMIGNALMNNKNVQRHQDMSNRSAYHRSSAGGSNPAASSTQKKSFFGNSASRSTSSSSSFGG